jgi:chemotaxis protein histidine kinase CheA
MQAGDRVIHIDGRRGVADEFLHDGDAFVSWDDGTFDTVKWNVLRRESARVTLSDLACGIVAIVEQERMMSADPKTRAKAAADRNAQRQKANPCAPDPKVYREMQDDLSHLDKINNDMFGELTLLRARVKELEANAGNVRATALWEAITAVHSEYASPYGYRQELPLEDESFAERAIRALIPAPPSAPTADVTRFDSGLKELLAKKAAADTRHLTRPEQRAMDAAVRKTFTMQPEPLADVTRALARLFWCIWCEDKRGAVAMAEAGLTRQVDAAEYALTDLGRAALAIVEKPQ